MKYPIHIALDFGQTHHGEHGSLKLTDIHPADDIGLAALDHIRIYGQRHAPRGGLHPLLPHHQKGLVQRRIFGRGRRQFQWAGRNTYF